MKAAEWAGSEVGFVAGLKMGSILPARDGNVMRLDRPAIVAAVVELGCLCGKSTWRAAILTRTSDTRALTCCRSRGTNDKLLRAHCVHYYAG